MIVYLYVYIFIHIHTYISMSTYTSRSINKTNQMPSVVIIAMCVFLLSLFAFLLWVCLGLSTCNAISLDDLFVCSANKTEWTKTKKNVYMYNCWMICLLNIHKQDQMAVRNIFRRYCCYFFIQGGLRLWIFLLWAAGRHCLGSPHPRYAHARHIWQHDMQ